MKLDSRLEKGTWNILHWWWEQDIVPDAEMLAALRSATARFLQYLQADRVEVDEGVDRLVRQAILDVVRLEV